MLHDEGSASRPGAPAPASTEGDPPVPSELDWNRTELGPFEDWHPVLRTAFQLCLDSSLPMSLTWGEDMVHLYNDAYLPIVGSKHPESFGRPIQENWPEVWAEVGPLFDRVRDTGEGHSVKEIQLVLNRHGFLEEAYLSFDLSPIRDGEGPTLGTFNPCQDVTATVLQQRRQQTVHDLSSTSTEDGPDELAPELMRVLVDNALDIPFAALYLAKDKRNFTLTATSGVQIGDPWFDEVVPKRQAHPWPLLQAAESPTALIVDNLESLRPALAAGPWPDPPRTAVVSTVQWSKDRSDGVLILGVSPRLPLDDDYLKYLATVTEQFAARLGAARTLAAEARRAATLEVAVRTNREIGAAIGILMSRHRITEDQAFALLTRTSQSENLKLRQVAERIVKSLS